MQPEVAEPADGRGHHLPLGLEGIEEPERAPVLGENDDAVLLVVIPLLEARLGEGATVRLRAAQGLRSLGQFFSRCSPQPAT